MENTEMTEMYNNSYGTSGSLKVLKSVTEARASSDPI